MRGNQLAGPRIWPELAAALLAYGAAHGQLSHGDLLRRSVPGLGPEVGCRRPLIKAWPGEKFQPVVQWEEMAAVRRLAAIAGVEMNAFIGAALCRLVGVEYVPPAQRQAWNSRAALDVVIPQKKRDASPTHTDAESRWPAGRCR